MTDINNWVNVIDTPWKFAVGVAILTLGPYALLSKETASEKFWLVGKLARAFRERKEKAADQEEELASRRVEDLWSEISRVDKLRERDRERFERRVSELEKADLDKYDYILYVTAVWRTVALWATNNGYTLPVQCLTFEEWLASRGGIRGAVEGGTDLAD